MKQPCKFCSNIDSGNEYTPLLSIELEFGFFGRVGTDVYMAKSVADEPYLSIGICCYEGTGEAEKKIPINFCPVCGRSLK